MKKVLLLAVMAVFYLSSFSQVVQNVDSIQFAKLDKIENDLHSYYKENRTSQVLILIGSAITTASILLSNPTSTDFNPFPYVGGACMLAGGVIYLDSFKFLNKNRRNKTKKQTVYYQYDGVFLNSS